MRTQPAHLRALNIVSVIVFGIYLVLITMQTIAITETIGTWGIIASAIFGYILADFLSGFVHFLGDTFGSESTPLLGPAFIFPFREHHVEPEAITYHDFIETNGHNCLVSIPVMMVMTHVLFGYVMVSAMASFVFTTLYFLILGVFLTNQIHKWAHMKNPPGFVQFLQHIRLILSPTHHKIHHTSPYTRYFCITTGWLNLLLDKLSFFPIAKSTLRRIPFMLKPAEEYTQK